MAGARVTGKVGKTAVGVMNMETGDESPTAVSADRCAAPYSTCTPRTNFSVVRLHRDILRRSNIGVMFTNRSSSPTVPGSNQAYGFDGAFSFFRNVTVSGYYARSESPNRQGRRRQLSGTLRIRRRPLWRAPRPSRCRHELLSGGRLRPASRLRPHLRGCPFQPAPARQGGAPLLVRGRGGISGQPRPPAGIEQQQRPLPHSNSRAATS